MGNIFGSLCCDDKPSTQTGTAYRYPSYNYDDEYYRTHSVTRNNSSRASLELVTIPSYRSSGYGEYGATVNNLSTNRNVSVNSNPSHYTTTNYNNNRLPVNTSSYGSSGYGKYGTTVNNLSTRNTVSVSSNRYTTKDNNNSTSPTINGQMKQYYASRELQALFKNNFENLVLNSTNVSDGEYQLIKLIKKLNANPNSLTEHNYLRALLLFADIEDLHCEEALKVYDRKSTKIETFIKTTQHYIISVQDIEKNHPLILDCKQVMIVSSYKLNEPIHGTITNIQSDEIVVRFDDIINTAIRYDVTFISNPTPYCMKSLSIALRQTCIHTYIIRIPNLNDSRPSISRCSRLKINSSQLKKPIYGTISDIEQEYILVEFRETINTAVKYDIYFLSNRQTFRMEKLAIDLMKQKNLVPFMFPDISNLRCSTVSPTHIKQHLIWFNKSVETNIEQQTVIENIYHGTSYPYPYILFGPPGTGKTTALVESVLQIRTNIKKSRILIVATSNFACNVIAQRLLGFVDQTEVYRLFSKSQDVVVDKIDSKVLKSSNLKGKFYLKRSPDELYKYRIIIATLATSGQLVQDQFNCKHFTHLFIDECGSCTEGSCLIPIAGLISSNKSIKAHIVLSGDPLQLGPVIQSNYAEKLGYGVSLIERLMNLPLYQKDGRTGDYNNKFITKLRLNYRSHKDILHISNKLFYKNELVALGSKSVTDFAINWRYLPNPKFPIVFEAVYGQSLSENESPSLYNKHEIDVVMSYLKILVNKKIDGKVLRQTDIGIISPYRKQNQKIRSQCDYRKWRDIEVASVEAFQGNERRVIIFSTVRSNVKSMGFLSSERRLNVALTRAQGLLIIVGDPKVLMKDKCWRQLIKFCYDNSAICGEPFNFYNYPSKRRSTSRTSAKVM